MSQFPATPGAAKPADGLAIASLVCGIVGLVGTCIYGFGVIPAIAGLICGLKSQTKGGIRTAGIICSSIALGLCVVAILLLILGVGLMALGAASNSGAQP